VFLQLTILSSLRAPSIATTHELTHRPFRAGTLEAGRRQSFRVRVRA
jgi:hypothetical protein